MSEKTTDKKIHDIELVAYTALAILIAYVDYLMGAYYALEVATIFFLIVIARYLEIISKKFTEDKEGD